MAVERIPKLCGGCPEFIDETGSFGPIAAMCDHGEGMALQHEIDTDGSIIWPRPEDCPLLAKAKAEAEDEAGPDEIRDRAKDDALLADLAEQNDGYAGR